MDIPQDMEDFIKHSIDHALGLDVPKEALNLKIQTLEDQIHRLRGQYLSSKSALKDKDDAIELARGEATMNAQALKRFVEENQRLANECANLVSQCSKLENECKLYDQDREALMEFGNEADERAKKAESRVQELEEELRKANEETRRYKRKYEKISAGASNEGSETEQSLLNGLISRLIGEDEVEETALAFLQANKELEACHQLSKMWNSLGPSTRNILSLAAHVQILQREKEQLRINLHTAEEEVKLLDEDNRKLMRHCHSERKHCGTEGKHNSSAVKSSNKRKQRLRSSSPIKSEIESLREPFSPLSPFKENSPELRVPKK